MCPADLGCSELVETAGLYRQLLDLVDGACANLDPRRGQLLDANAAACSQLGYDRTALLGLPVADLLEDGRSDAARRLLRDIWRRREDTCRTRLLHQSGTFLEFVHPDDRDLVTMAFQESLDIRPPL